jgi:purine-nucleoside phosphorylase
MRSSAIREFEARDRPGREWKDAAVPAQLRPKAPVAADAILVGDPGRSLLLAQDLLAEPQMSNHARGLWGYTGQTAGGRELTIQATGIGGPSAAAVLADLAELGVRRAIRVGTCAAFGTAAEPGELLLVEAAIAAGGSAAAFGLAPGESVAPDAELRRRLGGALGAAARTATVASYDAMPAGDDGGGGVADMQTVAVLARARELEIAAAAVLIVSETSGERLADEALEEAARRAGNAAAKSLSRDIF